MKNGAERLSKPFTDCSSFRAAVSAVIQFSLRKKEKSFSGAIKVPSLHEEAKRAHYAPGRCSSLKCSYLKCSALIRVHYTPVQALCKLDVLSGRSVDKFVSSGKSSLKYCLNNAFSSEICNKETWVSRRQGILSTNQYGKMRKETDIFVRFCILANDLRTSAVR